MAVLVGQCDCSDKLRGCLCQREPRMARAAGSPGHYWWLNRVSIQTCKANMEMLFLSLKHPACTLPTTWCNAKIYSGHSSVSFGPAQPSTAVGSLFFDPVSIQFGPKTYLEQISALAETAALNHDEKQKEHGEATYDQREIYYSWNCARRSFPLLLGVRRWRVSKVWNLHCNVTTIPSSSWSCWTQ